MHAGDDLDQRRFAGAVLAEQGVNFAGMKRKRDVVERLRGVEALGDAANIQDRRNPSPRRRRFPAASAILSAPAGYVDDRAGDIGRSVAQEPDDRLGDFVCGSRPPERTLTRRSYRADPARRKWREFPFR